MSQFINTLWKTYGKYATVLGVVTAGVIFGTYLGPFFYEESKLDAKDQISAIETQIDSLNTVIDSDTVGYKNWIANHTNPVLFNSALQTVPFVTIGNYTSGECESIKDSICLGKWAKANSGNTMVIQMHFKNTNALEIKNAIIKLDYGIDSIKKVNTIYGNLVLGNHVFLDDSIKIYHNGTGSMRISQILAIQENNSAVIQKNSLPVLSEYGLVVGDLKPNSSETVTLSFIIY